MITQEDLDILSNLILDKEVGEKEMIVIDKIYNYLKPKI
jgi:hypothetical protein